MNIKYFMHKDRFFQASFGNPLVYLVENDYVCADCMNDYPAWGEDVTDVIELYEPVCYCEHCGKDIYGTDD